MNQPIVDCQGLVHIYKANGLEVVALQGLDLEVHEGETIAIVGRSGSGKTTLMNILAGVEVPSAGRAVVAGHDLTKMEPAERNLYRRGVVGYLWQQSALNLVPELTALGNVQLPQIPTTPASERVRRSTQLLQQLGLGARLDSRPAQLSGGEQQRLALAVAIANRPRVLLADEPTGELDTSTASEIMQDLRRLQQALGATVVLVTHDRQVEHHVDRVIRIRDGRTSTETRYVDLGGDVVADELVILDQAGRLQLPRAYVEALGLRGRVRVRREGDRLVILRAEGKA